MIWSLTRLNDTLYGAKRWADAEPFCRELLTQTQQQFGAEDPRTVAQMEVLAFSLLHQHKSLEAEQLIRDVLKVRETKQPDAWLTSRMRSLLGDALLNQKKYAEAEPLLLQGYEG